MQNYTESHLHILCMCMCVQLIYEPLSSILCSGCIAVYVYSITLIYGLTMTAGGFSLLHFHWDYAKIHNIVILEDAIYGLCFLI